MEPASRSGYMTATEVAAILHVTPKTVSRCAKEGKLPYMRTLGGHRRFPADALDAPHRNPPPWRVLPCFRPAVVSTVIGRRYRRRFPPSVRPPPRHQLPLPVPAQDSSRRALVATVTVTLSP